MPKTILTWDPDGRKGVCLLESEYKIVKDFIIDCISIKKEISLNDLLSEAALYLKPALGKDPAWYVLKVKLDLQARRIISRSSYSDPNRQQILKIRKSYRRNFTPVDSGIEDLH